jgi:hypothetical protein
MWALPNIAVLNEEAHRKAVSGEFDRAIEELIDPDTGEPAQCMYASEECDGGLRGELYYDIFSEDPKGVIFLCERHWGYYGSPAEGYFCCSDCGRTFIENYTHEMYSHNTEDGTICLNCWAQRVINDSSRWIELTEEAIESVDFETLRKAPHIFAVGGPRHGLERIGVVTFDSMTGGRVTGLTSCESSPSGGVKEIKKILRRAMEMGYQRALLVLDGAYQFAVDIGVYVDPKDRQTTYGVRGGGRRRVRARG